MAPLQAEAWQHLRTRYLDVPVEQLLGEMLQRHGGILRAVGLAVEGRDVGGVTGEGLGVDVLEGLEVVVDSMPHHDLPCEYLQDLKAAQGGEQGSEAGPRRPGPPRLSPRARLPRPEMPPDLLSSTCTPSPLEVKADFSQRNPVWPDVAVVPSSPAH